MITAVVWQFRNMPSIFETPTPSDWPAAADSSRSGDFPAKPVTPSPYKTEQEWIISDVCRNAFELLAFAKDKKGEALAPDKVTLTPIPGDVLSYDVTVQGATMTAEAKLQWPGSIWDPAAYVPFCQAAAQALKLPPPMAPKAQGNPLHALLEFSDPAIEAENQRVSQWLAAEPDNAAAHEQAALVVGTLAMKENSGWFWDPREACNHVCTHLAVAKFLRGDAPTSIEGRLADIEVGLIVDTKTKTGADLDGLAAEKDAPPDLAAWLNADRMRNTRDWRIVSKPESASPMEQVEYFRALGEAVNVTRSIVWLHDNSIAARPDWNRIVLESNFPVDAGHEFAQQGVTVELANMQATFPGSFSATSLIGDLNEPPGDVLNFKQSAIGVPTVISRGMWALYFQRHLCHAITELGSFYANGWGVPEEAQKLDSAVDRSFSGLSLYPYLRLVNNQLRRTRSVPDAELDSFRAHPEWGIDDIARFRHVQGHARHQLQELAAAWFNPRVIHGTAYGAMGRRVDPEWDRAQTDQLYAIAPLQIDVANREMHLKYGDTYTFAQVQEVYGPMLDYYVETMKMARDATDIGLQQKLDLMQKAADIDSYNYYSLAQLYQGAQQDDKAAEAYQNYFDKDTDRVSVSNRMQWLVNYYYDHGQQDKALAIAKDTAEVYSSVGLETMMELQEKMGHLDVAEDYGQKIMERYNESGALERLYQREIGKGQTAYQAKLDAMVKGVFPDGLKKATLASFSGAPGGGMIFDQTTDEMRAFGFAPGLVIVALDGFAVQSQAQYTFIREMSASPEMHFVVWDGQGYKELQANRPGRRFGVEMDDYHP